jgi:hypothetical protein
MFNWNTKQLFIYLEAEYTNAKGVSPHHALRISYELCCGAWGIDFEPILLWNTLGAETKLLVGPNYQPQQHDQRHSALLLQVTLGGSCDGSRLIIYEGHCVEAFVMLHTPSGAVKISVLFSSSLFFLLFHLL